MVEVLRYDRVKFDDLDIGEGFRETRLQDGRVALLEQLHIGHLLVPFYFTRVVTAVRPAVITTTQTLTDADRWLILPGGTIDVAEGITFTVNGGQLVTLGAYPIFSRTGTIKIHAPQDIDPVWFADLGGAGTPTDPWTSTDNSGGFLRAFAALQFEGDLKAAPGYYRFSSATPATTDLVVNSADGNLSIDLTGAVIQVTADVTVIKLNGKGIITDTSTNLNTVHITGGMITTQLPGVGQSNAPILGTGIDATRVRNLTIQRMRFLGLNVGILATTSDTVTIASNFFRRVKTSINMPDIGQTDNPQDMYITQNTSSITQPGGVTTLNGSSFVNIAARFANVHIRNNGCANSTSNSWFVKALTGNADGDSHELHIEKNATEQFGTGSKLVEITRFGTTELQNLRIVGNQWGSPLDSTGIAPFANGQPYLDLAWIKGYLEISNNEFTNNAVTAIKLANFVAGDAGAYGSSGYIRNNRFSQVTTNGGKILDIATVTGNQTLLTIGHNSMPPYYNADVGATAVVYPTNKVAFETMRSYTANLTAAATMTLSPWDNYIEISGTTIITAINDTWHGHEVHLLFETENGGVDSSAGLFLAGDFRARVPNESILCIKYDGIADRWVEVSRSNEVLQATVASAATLVIPEYARLVSVTGTVTITSITVPRHGVSVAFRGVAGATWSMTDGGNLFLAGNFTTTDNDIITLIPTNTDWYEQSRSAN